MTRILLVALFAATLTCARPASAQDGAIDLSAAAPTDEVYLFEVMRHLYRWHLDEHDVLPEINRGEFLFWVRRLSPALDEGDESEFIEVMLPRLGVRVRAKKANYSIPELDMTVRNDTYKITSVSRGVMPGEKPADAVEIVASYEEMRDRLRATMHALKPPSDELLERMRSCARRQFVEYLEARDVSFPEGEQVVHLGPLSPVANEAWVFWEGGRMLLRFTADVDLPDPMFWEHEELMVDFYSLDQQVVVSLDEVAGSNAYLTRDEVGRVLFNCHVYGRKVVLE